MKNLLLQSTLNKSFEGYIKLSGKYLVPQNTIEINTNLKADNANAIASASIYAHNAWYYKGTHERTYITYMQRDANPYYMMPTITYYDHATGTIGPIIEIGLISSAFADTHPLPTVSVDKNGYIYVVVENIHNSPFYVRKSNSPEDISAFTLINTVSTEFAYPKQYWQGDNFYLVGRRNFNNTTIVKSTDGGVTFSSPLAIDVIGSGTQERAYSLKPFQDSTNTLHLVICRRLDVPLVWTDAFYLKSVDGVTWTNVNETFSRNVSTGGVLTLNDLRNYYRYKYSGSDANDINIPVCTVTAKGTPVFTSKKAEGGYEFIYFDFDLDQWVYKDLEIPSEPIGAQGQPFVLIYSYSEHEFDVWVGITEGTAYNYQRWRTIDRGDNWSYVDTGFPDDGVDYSRIQLVGNYYACNKPIIISQKVMSGDYSNIMVKEYYK